MSNDDEKSVLKQYLQETLQQLELLKRESAEKDRKYSQLFLEHQKQRKEFAQQNELLMEQLEETRSRYVSLKRQDTLFRSVRNLEQEGQRPFPQESSVMSLDDLRIGKQQDVKLRELQQCLRGSQQKVADLQKQNTILTDYISLKEATYTEKIRKLEEQCRIRGEEFERLRKETGPAHRSRIRISTDKERESIDSLSPIKHIEPQSNQQQMISLNEKVRLLEREKKQLEAKVEKCTDTVRELQEYYTKEIDRLNDEIVQQRMSSGDKRSSSAGGSSELLSQLQSLQDRLQIAVQQKQQAQKDLQEMQRNFQFALQQIQKKRENEISEGEFSQFMLVQTLQKKYEHYIQDMKTAYEQKLQQYENKLQFMTLKLEHSQQLVDQKNTSQKLSSRNLQQFLAESKIVPAGDMRMSAGSSFASSIKESLNSRKSFKPEDAARNLLDRSTLVGRQNNKTPVKGAQTRPFGIFADRTNLM